MIPALLKMNGSTGFGPTTWTCPEGGIIESEKVKIK
jgi:hypothetical protein